MPLPPEQETELVRQVLAGRRDAFRPLVEQYWPRVRCLLRRMGRAPDRNEDLCQEIFLRAYDRLETFDLSRRFGPWLMKIGWNLVCETIRREGRRVIFQPLDENAFATRQPEPGQLAIDRAVIEECLGRLETGSRVLFLLRHGMQLSYEEIAFVLDEPLGTVKGQLFRIREQLKQALQPDTPEPAMEKGQES